MLIQARVAPGGPLLMLNVRRRLETGFMSPLFELTISLDLECKPNRIQTPCGDFARRLSVSKQFTDTTRTGRLKREFSQSPPLAGLSTPTGVPTRSETQ